MLQGLAMVFLIYSRMENPPPYSERFLSEFNTISKLFLGSKTMHHNLWGEFNKFKNIKHIVESNLKKISQMKKK